MTYGNVSKDAQYLPLAALLTKDISVRGFNLQRCGMPVGHCMFSLSSCVC